MSIARQPNLSALNKSSSAYLTQELKEVKANDSTLSSIPQENQNNSAMEVGDSVDFFSEFFKRNFSGKIGLMHGERIRVDFNDKKVCIWVPLSQLKLKCKPLDLKPVFSKLDLNGLNRLLELHKSKKLSDTQQYSYDYRNEFLVRLAEYKPGILSDEQKAAAEKEFLAELSKKKLSGDELSQYNLYFPLNMNTVYTSEDDMIQSAKDAIALRDSLLKEETSFKDIPYRSGIFEWLNELYVSKIPAKTIRNLSSQENLKDQTVYRGLAFDTENERKDAVSYIMKHGMIAPWYLRPNTEPQLNVITHISSSRGTLFNSTSIRRDVANYFAFSFRNKPYGVVFKMNIQAGRGLDVIKEGKNVSVQLIDTGATAHVREAEIAVPFKIESNEIQGYYYNDSARVVDPQYSTDLPSPKR